MLRAQEFVHFLIGRYQESGILWRWFDNVLSNRTYIMDYYLKPPADADRFEPLDCGDLSGALHLLVFGLTTSFIVFFGEVIIFQIKYQQRQRRVRAFRATINRISYDRSSLRCGQP